MLASVIRCLARIIEKLLEAVIEPWSHDAARKKLLRDSRPFMLNYAYAQKKRYGACIPPMRYLCCTLAPLGKNRLAGESNAMPLHDHPSVPHELETVCGECG